MWDYLKTAEKPIYLYGTGNAAEKIIAELNNRNIPITGIFASDGFVRNRLFCGFPLISYSQAKEAHPEMIVLLCFGSHLEEVIDNIKRIASEQELYAPDLPIAGGVLFTKEYKEAHKEEIDRVRNLLADEQSRLVYDNVMKYKETGKIDYLFQCDTDDDENWGILSFSNEEVYLDLGAYTGDTMDQFIRLTGGKYNHIIALEPDKRNFRKMGERIAKYEEEGKDSSHIETYQKAVGEKDGIVYFSKNNGRGGSLDKGKLIETELTSIDSVLAGRDVTVIKFDIEGEEPSAIAGGAKTIARCKPKMLIAAYHRSDDLWEIPKKVLAINPDYKVYLRKSPCLPAWEINYYFV